MKPDRSPSFLASLIGLFSSKSICWACFGILLLWIFFSGCKEDKILSDPVPFLKIESVTPTSVTQFQDSVIVLLSYDDGDGDLGFSNPDSTALEVTDSRFTVPDYYFVQALAPVGQVLHIRGSLRLALTPPFILGNGNQETIQYSIRIKDRAGNWSNTVTTPDITISQ